MTWIKTIRMEDDERVRDAIMEERKLLSHGVCDAGAHRELRRRKQHRGLTQPVSRRLVPCLQYFWRVNVADLPLRRDQHEMIATMVSVTNRCFY